MRSMIDPVYDDLVKVVQDIYEEIIVYYNYDLVLWCFIKFMYFCIR